MTKKRKNVEINKEKSKNIGMPEKKLRYRLPTFVEKFNGDKLAYIIYNIDKYSELIRRKSSSALYKGCPLTLAKKYLEKSKNQEVEVEYRQNDFDGRFCALGSLSLQMITRPIRHTICKDKYVDLDVVNCHPYELVQECHELNISCPHLEEYVNNRSQYIDGPNRDKLKDAYISMINGGSKAYNECKDICTDKKEFYMFKQELENIRLLFSAKYPKLFEEVKKKRIKQGKDYNHLGGLMNVILNEIENKILMAMFEYFGKTKYAVLCFDGIMLPKGGNYDLQRCEEYIKQKTGYSMKLKIKPFNEGLNLPDDESVFKGLYDKYMEELKLKKPDSISINNESVGKHFMKRFMKNIICNENFQESDRKLCLWDENKCIWLTGKNIIKPYIYYQLSEDIQTDFINYSEIIIEMWEEMVQVEGPGSEYESKIEKLKKDLLNFKSHTFLEKTCSWTITRLLYEQSIKKNVIFNMEKNTREYFQFKNGAFNLRTKKLEPRTREMFITEYLDYDYSDNYSKEAYKNIDKCFNEIQPDKIYRESLLKWRGYTMTGYSNEKTFLLMLGYSADNGKSFVSLICENAFPIYFNEIDADSFDSKETTKYQKAMSSLVGHSYRCIYMSEWGKNKQNMEKIKRFADGGSLKVQPLYQQEQKMVIQCKLEASSNYDPNVDMDTGLISRGKMIPFTSRFIDDKCKINPKEHIYLKDQKLTDSFFKPEFSLALFHYLLPYCNDYLINGLKFPEEFKNSFRNIIDENDEWAGFFHKHMKNTKSKDDYAYKDEIVNSCNSYFESKKPWKIILREMKKRGMIYDSNKTVYSPNKMRGGFQYWLCDENSMDFVSDTNTKTLDEMLPPIMKT